MAELGPGSPVIGIPTATIFLFAVTASAVLGWSDPGVYRFLFGDLDPLLVTTANAILGAVALRSLVVLRWFRTEPDHPRGVILAAVLGAALTVPVILVDLFGGFAADMNVRYPESLLFYPSIALVAESALHLVPLALVATVWRWTSIELSRARTFAIGIAAIVEPMLQVAWGSDRSPAWANAYVGVHLLIFNVVGLAIFRRWGFVALYGFRVGYYLVWHIAWGYARLPLLFEGGP